MKKILSKHVLEACERALIATAAVLAMFPMWQYYSEREDRKLDRAANLILAHETCLNFTFRDAFNATPMAPSPITAETLLEREIARWGYPIVELSPEEAATLDPEMVDHIEERRRWTNYMIELQFNTPLERLTKIQLPKEVEQSIQAEASKMIEDAMRDAAGAYTDACDAVADLVRN